MIVEASEEQVELISKLVAFVQRGQEIPLRLDIIMPDMSGKECLGRMLRFDTLVRVLVVSGHNPEDKRLMEALPHIKAFIYKHCSKHDLLSKICYAIDDQGVANNNRESITLIPDTRS